ncbi:MAG: ABC transporter substrate-binding protein, partial [Streptococcus sp.]
VRYGVGETLFKMDDKLEVKPWLAEKIEAVSDLEWKITLKDKVTFQNGEKMTGEKVKASLERLIKTSERAASDMGIDSISAEGQTVTIKTKAVQPIMANLLAEPYSAIVDTTGKSASDKAPVGTGPYMVTKYTPES